MSENIDARGITNIEAVRENVRLMDRDCSCPNSIVEGMRELLAEHERQQSPVGKAEAALVAACRYVIRRGWHDSWPSLEWFSPELRDLEQADTIAAEGESK